jgi:hypothetical protein
VPLKNVDLNNTLATSKRGTPTGGTTGTPTCRHVATDVQVCQLQKLYTRVYTSTNSIDNESNQTQKTKGKKELAPPPVVSVSTEDTKGVAAL